MNKTTTKRYSVSGLTPHDTLRNAKSDLDAAFDAANDATKGLVTALSRTDNALYSALQTIYEFVKEGEARPEEFEEFKRARPASQNADSCPPQRTTAWRNAFSKRAAYFTSSRGMVASYVLLLEYESWSLPCNLGYTKW